jgi:hypothetical protein
MGFFVTDWQLNHMKPAEVTAPEKIVEIAIVKRPRCSHYTNVRPV